MFIVSVDVTKANAAINRLLSKIGPSGRHQIFSVAANAVKILVQNHIRRIAPTRHASSDRLPGSVQTGHLSKGARAVTFSASPSDASVIVPIPGISRAYHDVTIRPVRSNALTIPIAAQSYGHRAAELTSLGWRIFKAGRKDGAKDEGTLFGSKDGRTVPLYLLRKSVTQRQDSGLLPTEDEIGRTATKSAARYIQYLKGAA